MRLERFAPPAIAALIAVASLGGILDGATYAGETADWAAQGVAQDWFDLCVLAPVLIAAWAWARRDPARGAPVLAGALAFTVYMFLIYAFAVHFNALFLVYCAVLGLSAFALGATLRSAPAPRAGGSRERASGGFFIGTAVAFAALWLAEIVPALVHRTRPPGLLVTGLFTNPVHVIDLSLVLPAFVAIGVALVRARPLGRRLGAPAAAFTALMALSIVALLVVTRTPGAGAVAAAMLALAAASAAVLVHLLHAEPSR
jgi:hypothetical protein